MKICSRCNNEVKKIDVTCPKCGFSLLKDEYGKRYDSPLSSVKTIDTTNEKTKSPSYAGYKKKASNDIYGNKTTSHDNNKITIGGVNNSSPRQALILIAIIFMVLSMLISIFSSFLFSGYEAPVDVQEVVAGVDIDQVNNYFDDIKLIAKDYYQVLDYLNENAEFTLKGIDDVTSLDVDDMTDDSCNVTLNRNAVTQCVLKTHESIGTYSNANTDMMDFYEFVFYAEESQLREILVELYGDAYDLYYLPGTELTSLDYKIDYERITKDIDNLMEYLDDFNM